MPNIASVFAASRGRDLTLVHSTAGNDLELNVRMGEAFARYFLPGHSSLSATEPPE